MGITYGRGSSEPLPPCCVHEHGRAFVAPSGQLSVVTVHDCKGHLLSGSELRVDGALDFLALDAVLACDDMPTVDLARHIRPRTEANPGGRRRK